METQMQQKSGRVYPLHAKVGGIYENESQSCSKNTHTKC
jgi:hypothetical protein